MTATRRGVRPALALLLALAGAATVVPTTPAFAAEEEPRVLEISPTAGSGYGEVTCEYSASGKKVVEKECEWLEFETQKSVTLKAIAEQGSEFVEFEGGEGSAEACNGKKNPCTVTLKEEYSYIEARFDEIEPTLDVKVTGEGEVACLIDGFPEFCEGEGYEFGAEVLLEPEAEEGWEFSSFKNGTGSASVCSGLTKPCAFVLEKNSTVEAVFVPAMRLLTVKKSGTGSGTVTSEPAGVSCGAKCTAKFAQGTPVTLKAAPATGSTFAGWSGADCSGAGSCIVDVEEGDVAVTATFADGSVAKRKLTVERKGTGTGTVTSSPSGIECGSTCSAEYDNGIEVTLTGTPGAGSEAVQWSGCTSVTGDGKCKVTMTAAKTVAATFAAGTAPPPEPKETEKPKGTVEGMVSVGARAKIRGGRARVRLTCSGGLCIGTLTLSAKLRKPGRPVVIGKAPFVLASGESTLLAVRLSASVKRQLKKSRTLRASAGGTAVAPGAVKLKLASR